MLDGHHRPRSVDILRGKVGVQWPAEPLRMRCAIRVDGKPISLAEVIQLSKIAIVSTAVVRRQVIFSNILQRLLSYFQASEESYGIRFGDVRILHIVEYMLSPTFLAAN